MMRAWFVATIILARTAVPAAAAPFEIFSPGFPPSSVDADGAVHEDWGQAALRMVKPEGAALKAQRHETEGFPRVVTTFAAEGTTLVQTVYRAPIWPGGVDVLCARVANGGAAATEVVLELTSTAGLAFGESLGVLGARPVVSLPTQEGVERLMVDERPWGCAGGVVPLPGWAKPEGACDPAFRNISAGMGGVPITYRFQVKAGAERQVVLGFCESHWDAAGQRPLEILVEGAARSEIDPVGTWGRHKPGCLLFKARDANSDGRIAVTIAPHPKAADKNTILNAIWVFAPDAAVDTAQVLRGELTAAAEYYVDVGGEKDQLLFRGDKVTYRLAVPPNAERTALFLLACPGATAPNPTTMAWTPETLWKAAEDVWAGYRPRSAR
jgi:hypothetical protein